jgi:hypothetical protein
VNTWPLSGLSCLETAGFFSFVGVSLVSSLPTTEMTAPHKPGLSVQSYLIHRGATRGNRVREYNVRIMDAGRTLTQATGRQSPPSLTQSSRHASDGENRLESSHGAWSGEESVGEAVEEDGSRKRRRPMSVSCVFAPSIGNPRTSRHHRMQSLTVFWKDVSCVSSGKSNVTEANQTAVGAHATVRPSILQKCTGTDTPINSRALSQGNHANTKNGRSLA